jgi:hypothetical protein
MWPPLSGEEPPRFVKITLSDQRRVKILNFAKTQGRQPGAEHVRFKMAPERLSHGGDARGKGLASGGVFVLVGAQSRGIAIVEHDVSTSRQLAMKPSVEKTGCSVR